MGHLKYQGFQRITMKSPFTRKSIYNYVGFREFDASESKDFY